MSVLAAHRERVASLNEAMAQLQRMHEQAYELWNRIVQVNRSQAPDRQQQLDALYDESYALAERTARLREETFGEISHESRLRLTSSAESAQPLLNRPDVGLMAAEYMARGET